MVNRPADGVDEGGAAPDGVIPVRHFRHLRELHPVVEHLGHIVKEDRGDVCLAGLLFLLFDHGVEAADGVLFQSAHGAAAVKDEDQFRQILFHDKNLLYYAVCFVLTAIV